MRYSHQEPKSPRDTYQPAAENPTEHSDAQTACPLLVLGPTISDNGLLRQPKFGRPGETLFLGCAKANPGCPHGITRPPGRLPVDLQGATSEPGIRVAEYCPVINQWNLLLWPRGDLSACGHAQADRLRSEVVLWVT